MVDPWGGYSNFFPWKIQPVTNLKTRVGQQLQIRHFFWKYYCTVFGKLLQPEAMFGLKLHRSVWRPGSARTDLQWELTAPHQRPRCCSYPHNPYEDCYRFRCLVNRGTMGVNSLPKTVNRQLCGCDLNPGPIYCAWVQHRVQGRLRHINDGANAPWKNRGEGFCRNLGGKCVNYLCTSPLSFCSKFPLQN